MDCKGALPDGACELSLLFTTDSEIQELNRTYRKKNKPTDVLSFPPDVTRIMGEERELLGDIVISLDTTQRQARILEAGFYEELVRLLIHGVLHLAGYDHEGVPEREANKMRVLEYKLSRDFGNYL